MKLIPHAVTRTVSRQVLQAGKVSPNLLFGVGVVGMIGSTVLACRATLKMEQVLSEAKETIEETKSLEHRKLEEGKAEDYSSEDREKDTALIYVKTAVKVAKLYAPALLLGAASVGCLARSHSILARRNLALTAAYVAIDQAFDEYRGRVVQKYGRDEDRQLRYGSEEVDIVDEQGQLTTVTRVSPDEPSMYARFFDQYSDCWSKEPEYNYAWLIGQQNWFNNLLQLRGHVFLNEVYVALGLPKTEAGQVVGWVLSKNDGDNYVDFGIFDDNQKARDFVNGREGAILLDFNIDGVIYDRIDYKRQKEIKPWQK